jgi:hypothetical protein
LPAGKKRDFFYAGANPTTFEFTDQFYVGEK